MQIIHIKKTNATDFNLWGRFVYECVFLLDFCYILNALKFLSHTSYSMHPINFDALYDLTVRKYLQLSNIVPIRLIFILLL